MRVAPYYSQLVDLRKSWYSIPCLVQGSKRRPRQDSCSEKPFPHDQVDARKPKLRSEGCASQADDESKGSSGPVVDSESAVHLEPTKTVTVLHHTPRSFLASGGTCEGPRAKMKGQLQ